MQVLSSSTSVLAVSADDADALHAQVLTSSLLNKGRKVQVEVFKELDYYMPEKRLASRFVQQRADGSYINLSASVIEGIAIKATEVLGKVVVMDLFAFQIIKDKNKVTCCIVIGVASIKGGDAKSVVIAEYVDSTNITIVTCQDIKDKAVRAADLCFLSLSFGNADAYFAAALSDGSLAVYAYSRASRSSALIAVRTAGGKSPLSIIQQPTELLYRFADELLCLWLAFDDGRVEMLQTTLVAAAAPAALERACSVEVDKGALAGALLRIESLSSRAGRGAALAMYFLNAKDNIAAVAVVDCRLVLAAPNGGSGDVRLKARPSVIIRSASRKPGLPALVSVDPLSVRSWSLEAQAGSADCAHSFDVLTLGGSVRLRSYRRLSSLSCQQKVIDSVCLLGVGAFADPEAELSLAPADGQSITQLPSGITAASCCTLWEACWHLLSGDRHDDIGRAVQSRGSGGVARAVVMEAALDAGLASLVCEYINAAAADDVGGVHSSYLLADIGSVHRWFLGLRQRLEADVGQCLTVQALSLLVTKRSGCAEDPALLHRPERPAGAPYVVISRLQSLLCLAEGLQAVAEALVFRKRASADMHDESDLAGRELQDALRSMAQQLLEARLLAHVLRTTLLCLQEPALGFTFMQNLSIKEALMQVCSAARPSAQQHSIARHLPDEIVGDNPDANTSLLSELVRRIEVGAPALALYTSSAADVAEVSKLLLGLLLLPLSAARAAGPQDWAEDAAATAAQVVLYVLLDAVLASNTPLSASAGGAMIFKPSAALQRVVDAFAGRAASALGIERSRAAETAAVWMIDRQIDAMGGVSRLCRESNIGADSTLFYAVVRRLLLSDLCVECRELLRFHQHSRSLVVLSSTGALALVCSSATPDAWLPGWHAARRYCKGLSYLESALARRMMLLFLMRWTASCGQLSVLLETPMDSEEKAAAEARLLELAADDIERRDPAGPHVELAVLWLLRVGRTQTARDLHAAHYEAALAHDASASSSSVSSLARRHQLLGETLGFPALQLRDLGGLRPGVSEGEGALPVMMHSGGIVNEFDEMSFSHSGFPGMSMQIE